MTPIFLRRRGIALSVAIMTIVVLAILAAVVLTLALNQSRMASGPVEGRTRAYYRAQAGLVDAKERIRLGSCPACRGACTACDTTCATFIANCPYEVDNITANYTLDVEGDGTAETTVAISAADTTTKIRTITVTGPDT